MFEVVLKVNGKVAVKSVDTNRINRNLRYSVYECMKVKKMNVQNISDSMGVPPDNVDRFLKSDPEMNGMLPKKLCEYFNLDQKDYPTGYFRIDSVRI